MATMDRISVEPLDVNNYAVWSVRMKYFLTSKGYWKVVEDGPQEDRELDHKALALIGLSVKDHHLSTLEEHDTAKGAWEALRAMYKAKSTARRLQLKRELNSLKKAAEEPLTKFLARAKELRDQLAAAGQVINREDIASAILAGLPSEYSVITTVLESSGEDLDPDTLLPKLLMVEQRLAQESAGQDKRGLLQGIICSATRP